MKKFLTSIMALVVFTQTLNFNICLSDISGIPFGNAPNLIEENDPSNSQESKEEKHVRFDPSQVIPPTKYKNVYGKRVEEEENYEYEENKDSEEYEYYEEYEEDEKDKICKFCLLI